MIAVLMIYAAAVSALLFGAALALEFFARAIGAPTRSVWAITMVSSACLSVAALARPVSPRTSVLVNSDFSLQNRINPMRPVQPPKVRWIFAAGGRPENRLLALEQSAMAQLERATTVGARRFARFDIPLAALWALSSLLCFAHFAVGAARVRRAGRALGPGIVGRERVLVSRDLGPALLGAVRSRIVVPEWVLTLPDDEQRLIVAHERSHRDAFDPVLALAAALLVALQPWNAALWAVLSRLRLAIEADCDRRVLRGDIDGREAHRYGELLLGVYQRSVNGIAPTLAFVERRSSLETRILRLTRGRPSAASLTSVAAITVAVLAIATACALPRPARRVEPTTATDRVMPRPEWQASINFSNATSAPVRRHALCGSASPPQEHCSADGDIVVRAVDDRHVIVGVLEGDARATTDPVDHLFLVTAYEPLAGLQVRVFLASHFEYSRGTLRVSDPRGQGETLVFTAGRDTIEHSRETPPARRFTNLSMSQYIGHSLTLAMIPSLTRAPSCQPADHVCYSIDRINALFP